MSGKTFRDLLSTKTLMRVAITIISLSGIPHASPANEVTQTRTGTPYNFMAGGGG